jgi:L-iditol 2-dehydrogenase
MLAVVFRGPGSMVVEDVPMPECPREGLLLEVIACGLCGGDLRTFRTGHRRVTPPWIIGHEIAGRVAEVGSGYRGSFRRGDLLAVGPVVYDPDDEFVRAGRHELCVEYREIAQDWPGGLAEYVAVPSEALACGSVHRIPEGMDPSVAAVSEPVSSCVNAQEKGQVGLGDTVVIIGAGPIGCIHVALARARGAGRMIIADVNATRLGLARVFEPDHLVDASEVDLVDEVLRLTGGRGADVIITANPVPETLVQAVEMARKGGRILVFGGLPKERSRPGIDMNRVHYHALHLIGTTIFAPHHQATALRLLASGRIPADRLITERLPLSRFREGLDRALAGGSLKTVFLCQTSPG